MTASRIKHRATQAASDHVPNYLSTPICGIWVRKQRSMQFDSLYVNALAGTQFGTCWDMWKREISLSVGKTASVWQTGV